MRDREPTIRSRELGEGLRHAMDRAGLNGKETARLLGWSESRVSRLLSGKRGTTEVDVSAFLAVCRVKGGERDRLLRLCQEQNTPGWLQRHGSVLPKQLRTLIDHENKAIRISAFEPMLVPGLLQTTDYARALFQRSGTVPVTEIEDRVEARMTRKSVFGRDRRAEFTFFVHELALHLPVGGAEVMLDQLRNLKLASMRSYIGVRVVPAALGAHAGSAGSFWLMEFAEFKPVAYLESETSSLFLEDPDEIAAYQKVLAALDATALDAEQSRHLIATLATTLYGDREDRDERV